MSFRALIRNEAIKAAHRPAFKLLFGVYGALLLFACYQLAGIRFGMPGRFGLPRDAWSMALSQGAALVGVFAVPALTFLIASEFNWRTARQNVIDGLTKTQFFTAKLLLIPALLLLFYGTAALVTGAFSLATGIGDMIELRGWHLQLLGGTILSVLGFLSITFFLALLLRNAGAVLAALAGYVFLEQMLRAYMLQRLGFDLLPRLLPTSVFAALAQPEQYAPLHVPHHMHSTDGMHLGPWRPYLLPTGFLLTLAVIYIELLLASAFVLFRKRDL
jgi:ABC-type transport system involved in multi-copper enzyme maturation permease subunit